MIEEILLKDFLFGVIVHDFLKILDGVQARLYDITVDGSFEGIPVCQYRQELVNVVNVRSQLIC